MGSKHGTDWYTCMIGRRGCQLRQGHLMTSVGFNFLWMSTWSWLLIHKRPPEPDPQPLHVDIINGCPLGTLASFYWPNPTVLEFKRPPVPKSGETCPSNPRIDSYDGMYLHCGTVLKKSFINFIANITKKSWVKLQMRIPEKYFYWHPSDDMLGSSSKTA